MTQRRLLIVTYHFPPSGAVAVFRMLGFARHLPRLGWQVGVVAPPRVPGEPVDEALLQQVPPETLIFPAPYPESRAARVARRVFFQGIWLPRGLAAVAHAMREFRPDAVLTSGPPHCVHLVGLLLKRTFGTPWVACLRDPFYTNCSPDYGWFPGPRWQRYWERAMIREADGILANTPHCCEGLRAAYPEQHHKIDFVTNGFDPELFSPPAPLVPKQSALTILHAGEIYNGRDPGPFFDALKALEQTRGPSDAPVQARLLGRFTDNGFDPRPMVKRLGLEQLVEVGGQVPYKEALLAMSRADILLLLDAPGKKVSIPAKLFEYFGAARPILALCEPDSDTAWALKASGNPHRIAAPLDVPGIRRALAEMRDGWRNGTLTQPSPGQVATFTRAHLAEKLASHLNRIVAKRQPVPSLSQAVHEAPHRIRTQQASSRPHYAGA